MALQLAFCVLDKRYTLTQLPPGAPFPGNANGSFMAMIASREGISIMSEEAAAAHEHRTRAGFRCLEVSGTFDIESVGVLAAAVEPLAHSGISVFAYSTWERDYMLVQEKDLDRAIHALREAGHSIAKASLEDGPS